MLRSLTAKFSSFFRDKPHTRLDFIAAITGGILGIIIICLEHTTNVRQQEIGFVLLLSCLLYLVLRNKLLGHSFVSVTEMTRRQKQMINIIFLLIFTTSLILWYNQLYHRPMAYFILLALLAGLIAIEIASFREGNSAWPILFKTILLSANIRIGIYYEFPSLNGPDTYAHFAFAQWITDTGFLPFEGRGMSNYLFTPLFHIDISMTQILTSLSLKDSMFFSTGLASIILTALCVYLAGKSLAGSRAGLSMALLASGFTYLVIRGVNLIPESLSLCFFMLLVYLLFRERKQRAVVLLIILLTFSIILTHQLSVFVIFVSIASLYIGKKIYGAIRRWGFPSGDNWITLGYTLFFGVSFIGYWMYIYPDPNRSFFAYLVMSLKLSFITAEFGMVERLTATAYHSTLTNALFSSGYLILFFLAVGGALLWLSANKINSRKLAIIVAIIVIYAIAYGGTAFNIYSIIPYRWLILVSFLLVLLAGQYTTEIISLARPVAGRLLLFSLAFTFVFFSITTPCVNEESYFYAMERGDREQYTRQEMVAALTILDKYEGKWEKEPGGETLIPVAYIRTDETYQSVFRLSELKGGYTLRAFKASDMPYPSRIAKGTITVFRHTASKEPVRVGLPDLVKSVYVTFPEGYPLQFETPDYELFYDNGGVIGYVGRQ